MSAVRNARKKGVSKPVRSPIRERGRLRNGANPEMISFSETPPVPAVKHRLEYRTIQISRSMVNPNISNSQEQLPSVSLVIEVCTVEGSDARNVVKLGLNPAVNSAMVACLEVIESELSFKESTKTENAMPITKSRDDGRESGKRSGV